LGEEVFGYNKTTAAELENPVAKSFSPPTMMVRMLSCQGHLGSVVAWMKPRLRFQDLAGRVLRQAVSLEEDAATQAARAAGLELLSPSDQQMIERARVCSSMMFFLGHRYA
jgi:hypothetical protein